MELSYYQMTYDDIAQISEMEQEFFSTPWSEASIGHYAEAGNTIFIVARTKEPYRGKQEQLPGEVPGHPAKTPDELPRKVAGYAALLCAADEGNLVSIGVRKEYRQMGIATELLDILYELAAQRGVASINLEVRESNLPAIRFYEKEGFERTGKRPGFYRNPTEDALLYIRQLQEDKGNKHA